MIKLLIELWDRRQHYRAQKVAGVYEKEHVKVMKQGQKATRELQQWQEDYWKKVGP